MPPMAYACRVRKSPYFRRTEAIGCKAYTVYNRMMMPLIYDFDKEYEALTNSVAIWDVAAERQVELLGPDAHRLAQMLTCRDVSEMEIGECKYAIMCDDKGNVINDPVLLKLSEDRYWFSIADSDILLWAQAHATSLGLDVEVSEPDGSPLALQGPKSLDLVTDLFGDKIDTKELRVFWFVETDLDGIPLLLARSGWSPENGYELYLMDKNRGADLWDKVWEAGQKYDIFPGAPNQARRIEGGMISFGGDTDHDTNALELGLPKRFVDLDQETNFIGKLALKKIKAAGVKRTMVGMRVMGGGMDGDLHRAPKFVGERLRILDGEDGEPIGQLSAISNSKLVPSGQFLAMGLVGKASSKPGTELYIEMADGTKARAFVEKLSELNKTSFLTRQVSRKHSISPSDIVKDSSHALHKIKSSMNSSMFHTSAK